MVSRKDYRFLSTALTLAHKGGAAVRPNPRVGALLVKDGEIRAEGYHAFYGGPHAEAVALEEAGDGAEGATLYCNLEPCSFSAADKHNEPCTGKIIRAGVSRVVIGQVDPNPRVRGRGIAQLRNAGIEVELASESLSSQWYSNARFNTVHALNRTFVSLKIAQSLDGRMATSEGDSKWITDEAAREEVHHLRAEHDAVLVGIGTVIADNPRLTVRTKEVLYGPGRTGTSAKLSEESPADRNQPLAVVLDTHARIPLNSLLVLNRAEKLVVCTADEASAHMCGETDSAAFAQRLSSLRKKGIRLCRVPADKEGRLSLPHVMSALKERGINSVMVEGGAETATSFLNEGLYDALYIYSAPVLLGGDGRALGPLGVGRVSEAVQLEWVKHRTVGNGCAVSGFRKGWLDDITRSMEGGEHVYRTG